MPQTDEEFVDFVLHTISNDLRRLGDFSNGLLDSIDKQINSAAHTVRGALHSSPWVPDHIRPSPPPPPPVSRAHALQSGVLGPVVGWVHRHRAVAAAIVAFVGTGTFLIWRQRRWRRLKRRARRAASGAKTEVVILAGSPHSLLTQSLATDLQRRGFLVFIPVSSVEDETAVTALRLVDVRPLNFDITSPESTAHMVDNFANYLANPHRHGTSYLHLTSLIIAEADTVAYPTGAISGISSTVWLDSINSHLLYPVSLVHAFLPLLIAPNLPLPSYPTENDRSNESTHHSSSTILLLTQSNTASLHLPLHACESLTSTALTSYVRTLQSELPRGCRAVHLRLGALDFEGAQRRDAKIPIPSKLIRSANRHAPGQTVPSIHLARQTRELHLAVFDAIAGTSSGGTVFVGPGARTYAVLGALAPRNLVLWMAGLRRGRETMGRTMETGRDRRLLSGDGHGSRNGSGSESEVMRSLEWETLSDV